MSAEQKALLLDRILTESMEMVALLDMLNAAYERDEITTQEYREIWATTFNGVEIVFPHERTK